MDEESLPESLHHLTAIKNSSAYASLPRYKRAVGIWIGFSPKLGKPGKCGWAGELSSMGSYRQRVPETCSKRPKRRKKVPSIPFFDHRLAERLERTNPKQIGFSLNFLTQAISTFAMAGFIKRHFPGLPLILGGGLVTSWVRMPGWRNPFSGLIEKMVAGPGEIPILSSLGIHEKAEKHFLPDFDLLPISEYFSPGFVLPYSTTRGCYWNRCLFCPERAEGNPYSAIPPARAVADLSILVEKYKPNLVHLLDNALPPAVLEEIARNPFGASWYGFARVTPHLANPDFCLALKRSGCVMLQLGVESGDQGVLDQASKRELISKSHRKR